MARILDRREGFADYPEKLALDLDCGCILVLSPDQRASAAGNHFDCPEHDLDLWSKKK